MPNVDNTKSIGEYNRQAAAAPEPLLRYFRDFTKGSTMPDGPNVREHNTIHLSGKISALCDFGHLTAGQAAYWRALAYNVHEPQYVDLLAHIRNDLRDV